MGFVLFCSSGNEPDITHLSGPLSVPSSLRSSCLYLLSLSVSLCLSFCPPGLLYFFFPLSLTHRLSCFFIFLLILSILSAQFPFFARHASFSLFLFTHSSYIPPNFLCIHVPCFQIFTVLLLPLSPICFLNYNTFSSVFPSLFLPSALYPILSLHLSPSSSINLRVCSSPSFSFSPFFSTYLLNNLVS